MLSATSAKQCDQVMRELLPVILLGLHPGALPLPSNPLLARLLQPRFTTGGAGGGKLTYHKSFPFPFAEAVRQHP